MAARQIRSIFSKDAAESSKLSVVFKLLAILAKSLGYDCTLMPYAKDGKHRLCSFVSYSSYSFIDVKTVDGHQVQINSRDADGNAITDALALYCTLARELYKILDSREALVVNDMKLYASDVTEFMVMGTIVLS